MRGEKRITEKDVAAILLPRITEARELLASHLASLRYLWVRVDKKPNDTFSMGCFALGEVEEKLKNLESELCRI